MGKGAESKTFSLKNSGKLLIITSLVLILSISLVSAGFLDGLLRALGIPITGGATTETCFDSDGTNNFAVAGYVDIEGSPRVYDYCTGNVAADYYCADTDPPICDPKLDPLCNNPALTLPIITGNVITGNVVGDAPFTTKDCIASGLTCIGGGICGCSPEGSTQQCGSTDVGECQYGTMTCTSGAYTSCQGAVYSVTEVCTDGKDNDCDGKTDCVSGNQDSDCNCRPTSCPTDTDGDGYGTDSSDTSCDGYPKIDCNPNNSSINPGATEVCGDGVDNDCNSATSDTCPANCGNGAINSGEECDGSNLNNQTCITQGFTGGTLTCTSSCTFNTAQCTSICTPKTCAELGKECNTWNDGCGVTIDCGQCLSTESCVSGICQNSCPNRISQTTACANKECGTVSDGCSGQYSCGIGCNTAAGEVCSSNICVQQCTDSDNDGYGAAGSILCDSSGVDCDDTDDSINHGAEEICDGIDNNCNGNIDEGLFELIECQPDQESGSCSNVRIDCVNGEYEKPTCEDNGLKTPLDDELKETNGRVKEDKLDNDCDGLTDEGAGCLADEVQECNTGNACEVGEQKCVNSVFSSTCDVVDTLADCDADTACSFEDVDTCYNSVGQCIIGLKECQEDETWGECDGRGPVTETCDGLDNDCDGQSDEGCVIINERGEAQTLSSPEGLTGSEGDEGSESGEGEEGSTPESRGFLKRLLEILAAIFKFGRVLMGQAITETTPIIHCSDSDGGISYFVKGTGSGLNAAGKELWFQDTCYKENLNNQVDKCAGADCFLIEYSCQKDEKHFTSESGKTCEFGCAKGACIPTRGEAEECEPYFDPDLFEYIDPCA